MLEFNSDGSVKLPERLIMQQEAQKQSVIITKEQISVKPAKAQLRIKLPENMNNIDELINFYYKINDSEFRSVEHSIQKINEKTFLVKVSNGSMLMYGLLNFIAGCFREKLTSSGCKVVIEGSWDNYWF